MRRDGFTLVEVLVAVTVTAVAAALAVAIFSGVSDNLRLLERVDEEQDRHANARGWLRDALASMEPLYEDGFEFVGTDRRMQFRSQMLDSSGMRTSRQVVLFLSGTALLAVTDGDSLYLARDVRWGRFDYLTDYGANAPFGSRWESRIAPPVAVRVLIEPSSHADARVDTILLWVGDRT